MRKRSAPIEFRKKMSTEVDTSPLSFLFSIVECERLDVHFRYSVETQILDLQLHIEL